VEVLENKVLLLKTRTPEKLAAIPKHKVVRELPGGGSEVAVHLGLDEVRVLRNLGFSKAPSPILYRYDWPGRYVPMAHQLDTASFLTINRRAFCFNEPGTGKTLSALWAADYLMRHGYVRRVLVICPMSIMHTAWLGDIMNSVIHRSAVVAHHSKASRRLEMVRGDYDFVITNYEGVELISKAVIEDDQFDLIIVDEANAYKNPQTSRWKALKSIVKPQTYVWMMTGTPAAQSPVDAYGLAKLVCPQNVPPFFTAWREKVMIKITDYKWVPKAFARDEVFNVLQPAIRYAKKDCLDLPPVMTETREVPMSPQQAKYYKMLKEQLLIHTAGETISAVNAGVAVSKLLQISAGAAYTDGREVIEFDAKARMSVLSEVIEETDRKVIIFAMFRSSMDAIEAHLKKQGLRVAQINGDVRPSRRGEIINAFQDTDELDALVLQAQATAHGITLTAADTVIFYGPLMSVELYMQCIARADRKGQTSDRVRVIHIQSSPIEKKMFTALQGRVSDHGLLTGLFDMEVTKEGGVAHARK
jgi:SNF2 family DNA or RNA helicase